MIADDYLRIHISQLELVGILNRKRQSGHGCRYCRTRWTKRAYLPDATWMHLRSWLKEMDFRYMHAFWEKVMRVLRITRFILHLWISENMMQCWNVWKYLMNGTFKFLVVIYVVSHCGEWIILTEIWKISRDTYFILSKWNGSSGLQNKKCGPFRITAKTHVCH